MYTLLALLLTFIFSWFIGWDKLTALSEAYSGLGQILSGALLLALIAGEIIARVLVAIKNSIKGGYRQKNPRVEKIYYWTAVVLSLILVLLDSLWLSITYQKNVFQELGISKFLYGLMNLGAYQLMVYGFFNMCSNIAYLFSNPQLDQDLQEGIQEAHLPPPPVHTPSSSNALPSGVFNLQYLNQLNQHQFALLVGRYHQALGQNVQFSPPRPEGTVDVLAEHQGLLTQIACKKYAMDHLVTEGELRSFVAELQAAGMDRGVCITTSSFTREAEDYARQAGIDAVTGLKFLRMLHQQGHIQPV